jgi:hypothetical protein
MRPARTTFKTAARRLAALALGLWLSGAGCLACCERTGAASHAVTGDDARNLPAAIREAGRPAPQASNEAPRAGMSAGHSCCKARVGARARGEAKEAKGDAPTRASRDVATETDGRTGREARRETVPGRACCRRILRAAEQARKPRVEPAQAHAPSTVARPATAHAPREHTFAAPRARAPDRGATYLLCRTLLI